LLLLLLLLLRLLLLLPLVLLLLLVRGWGQAGYLLQQGLRVLELALPAAFWRPCLGHPGWDALLAVVGGGCGLHCKLNKIVCLADINRYEGMM
jgi:hypothetical protein